MHGMPRMCSSFYLGFWNGFWQGEFTRPWNARREGMWVSLNEIAGKGWVGEHVVRPMSNVSFRWMMKRNFHSRVRIIGDATNLVMAAVDFTLMRRSSSTSFNLASSLLLTRNRSFPPSPVSLVLFRWNVIWCNLITYSNMYSYMYDELLLLFTRVFTGSTTAKWAAICQYFRQNLQICKWHLIASPNLSCRVTFGLAGGRKVERRRGKEGDSS